MAHGDLTGNVKAELAEKHAAEQAALAKSISMATAALEAEGTDDAPIELKTNEELAPVVDVDGEIEIQSVDESEKTKTFRVNTDLDDVTIGYGNTYSFKRGTVYTAPFSVYWHLESKGLVWH